MDTASIIENFRERLGEPHLAERNRRGTSGRGAQSACAALFAFHGEDDRLIVLVLRVGHRKEIYR